MIWSSILASTGSGGATTLTGVAGFVTTGLVSSTTTGTSSKISSALPFNADINTELDIL